MHQSSVARAECPRNTAAAVTLLLTAATITSAAGAAEATADGDRPIEEIIVPGYYQKDDVQGLKVPTAAINVPQSFTVITREQIDEQAFTNIGDVLRYTPGASIGQGEGHRDQITIRGQNTTADFFLNGIRDDVQYYRPFYNLERIEILRGANALVFGRGGGGGVINRVTKRPTTDATMTSGDAAVDTLGNTVTSIDSNITLGDSRAMRVNAYYESLNNHRDFFGGDRFAINPTFLQEIGQDTSLVFSYEYVDDSRVVDRGVPSLRGEPLRGFDNTFFGDPEANRTTLSAHIANVRLTHDFNSSLSLDSTLQYADYDKFYRNLYPVGFDDIATTVSLDGYEDATERENLIFQTNLVGSARTGILNHTFLVGLEYGDQQTNNARKDILFEDSNDDQITFPFTDPLVVPAFSFPEFTRDRSSDLQFLSLYVQDEMQIGRHVILVGGVRYDRFDISVDDFIEMADGPGDGNDGRLSRVDEELSPRAGIIVKPVDSVSIYSSFTRSFLPRSGDQFLSLSPSSAALEPEKFENLEAGVKWDVRNDLSLTAAVFRLDRESGTTVDPNNPENSILIGTRTTGFEFQATGSITDRWSVITGYSYLDANERGRVVDDEFANRTLSQVPRHMFSIWNRVEATQRLTLGLGANYQADQFATLSNNVTLPDYVRFDAAVNYRLNDRLGLQLNVENLFNTDYFPDAHNDNNISTGEPLNARITLRGRL
jgi:catecholate siderophore receptor